MMKEKNILLKKLPFSAASLFLFLVLLFIRLPFFFRDYIDRDESTFILMGQSIADGYLPYDRLWDLKPPLLFYIFGLIEYVFPYSLIAVRLFGVMIIFSSAVFLLQIARATGLKNGFWIALSYILLSSMFGSVQGVMSEHVAVFFMLAGLLLFVKKKNIFNLFIAGSLFGCALLCKINYAYPAVALVAYYFINGSFTYIRNRIKNIIILSTGILLPFILIAIPFILENKLPLFIDSVFLAPFEYGQASHVDIVEKLRKTWWMILLGLVVSFFAIRHTKEEQKEITWLCALILLATIYTLFSIGTINGHYLLQVYPFIALLVIGIIIPKEFKPKFTLLTFFILLISIETITEYYRLSLHYIQQGTLYNGKSFTTIKELKKRQLENKRIFFADYHIGYWFLHQYPLSKSTTHPSNLARPYLFKYFGSNNNSSMQELKYFMEEIEPEVLVTKNRDINFFIPGTEEYLYIQTILANRYNMISSDSNNRIYIWQLNDTVTDVNKRNFK